jgi:hypothetical protein
LGPALLGWIAGDMILTDIFITENFKGISNYSILPIFGSLFVLTFCFLYKIIKK